MMWYGTKVRYYVYCIWCLDIQLGLSGVDWIGVVTDKEEMDGRWME